MTPEPPPEVIEYIRANRGVYTRAAIERELREAGHSQAAIDAAWGAFPPEGEAQTPGGSIVAAAQVPERGVVNTVQFWVLLVVVACIALTALPYAVVMIVGLAASAATSISGTNTPTWLDNGLAFVVFSLLLLLAGYAIIGGGGWLLRRRDRAAAYGVFGGLIVSFVLSVIIAGACAAIIAQL
jgi:hypothetical protein